MNLASELEGIEPRVCTGPWAGHEHARGYAVMMLPFSSGYLLGLRVFPETDFAPYESVWLRRPGERWSVYSDAPSLETACPRWWGPALERADLTRIQVGWLGPTELRVEMEEPRLVWTMSMTAPLRLRALNAVSRFLPLWTWKPAFLVRLREWIADRFLAMGDLRFSFRTPRGHDAILMPERIFFIETAEAVLEGRDLGRPVRLPTNPTVGGVALPTRPSFIVGQAHGRILDPEEYRRTRESVGAATSPEA